MQGDYFIYDIRFHGVNFPANGPVMQKKMLRWEPSTEKMYVRDGMLKGDVAMALEVEGGGHYVIYTDVISILRPASPTSPHADSGSLGVEFVLGSRPCSERFFSGYSVRFSPLLVNQHFQIPI